MTTQTVDQHAKEVAQAERFEFGANWREFLRVLNDERIAESSVSELKKFVKGYTTPGMMEILAQWLAPLLLKALRYRRPKGI